MPGISDSVDSGSWGSLGTGEADFFQYLLPSSDDTPQINTSPSSGLESIIESSEASPSPSTTFFESPLSPPNLGFECYPQMFQTYPTIQDISTATLKETKPVVDVFAPIKQESSKTSAKNNKESSKKRTRETPKKNGPEIKEKDPSTLSREDLLKLSSKDLEELTQNVTTNRTLTTEEEKQLKKQRRLIKNRESAQLSRLRKKFYIEELEKKVAQLTQENETLSKQLTTNNGDMKKLQDEVTYLRSLVTQYQQGTTVQISGSSDQLPFISSTEGTDSEAFLGSASAFTSLFPNNGQTSSATSNHRNVKTAGICLLVLLFSFGLLFNAQQGSLDSEALVSAGSAPVSSFLSAAKLNGRHLLEDTTGNPKQLRDSPLPALPLPDPVSATRTNNPFPADDKPRVRAESYEVAAPAAKRQRVRIDEDNSHENRLTLRKENEADVLARRVTSSLLSLPNSTQPTHLESSEWRPKEDTAYLYCPQQPQVVFQSTSNSASETGTASKRGAKKNGTENSQVPENIALLIPSSILSADPSQIDPSMLEVNCQVLSYYSWPIAKPKTP